MLSIFLEEFLGGLLDCIILLKKGGNAVHFSQIFHLMLKNFKICSIKRGGNAAQFFPEDLFAI